MIHQRSEKQRHNPAETNGYDEQRKIGFIYFAKCASIM